MNQQIDIYFKKSRLLKLIILGAIIFFIGIKPIKSNSYIFQVAGWLCLMFSTVCVFVGIFNLFRKKAVTTISLTNGIIDSRILKSFVTWNEIDHAQIIRKQNQFFLVVTAKDFFSANNFKGLFRYTTPKNNGKITIFHINLEASNAKCDEIKSFLLQNGYTNLQ